MYNKVFMNADISDFEAKEKMARCVQDSLDCQEICLQTVTYCLRMSNNYPVRLLLDCIEMCQVNTDFLIRGSKLKSELCEVCAIACERCEEFCKQFYDDTQMKMCAQVCGNCADSCREMAKIETKIFLS